MITQQQLREKIQAGGFNTKSFVKDVVVEFYSPDSFPQDLIGTEDNTSYKTLEGKLIAVQTKKDGIDAYAVDESFVDENYRKVECNKEQIVTDANRVFCGVKNTAVEMVPIVELGLPAEGTIEAPWGGTQDYKKGAYLVIDMKGGPYVINPDENGNPIGYIPAW